MASIRVGVIGLGIGEKHIDAYLQHAKCEVAALCDLDERKLALAGQKCPTAVLTTEADEILMDPEIHAVSIASFDNFHCEQVLKGIRNGKHIFVEKPLCLHRHEALEIRRALRERPDLRLSSNLNLRTCPRFIRVREAISSGDMGRIFYLEGDYLWGRTHKLLSGWRGRMPFYSIIHGAAVHMIDLIMWMSGMRPVEVQATGNRIALDGSDFQFNDFAVMILKFENGMAGKISASGGCVHPHFHRVAVFGTRRTFFNDLGGGRLLDSADESATGELMTEAYPGVAEKGKVITSFVDSLLYPPQEPIVAQEDVMATMSVCLAAEESMGHGRTVRVEYI
ncbi:MAG: Gfo/Idh/MocA family oxidoreductase [Deltaproteobacteria bacterium]|nr:Gfo/Idh/MocA family oxidoreductase [Deltaproteobacteria bacterium]